MVILVVTLNSTIQRENIWKKTRNKAIFFADDMTYFKQRKESIYLEISCARQSLFADTSKVWCICVKGVPKDNYVNMSKITTLGNVVYII